MSVINPISQTATSKATISSLDLMKLIMKINSQFEKTSFESLKLKRSQLTIFDQQSQNHAGSKTNEAYSMASIAVLSVAAQVSSVFATGMMQTVLKATQAALPTITQATTSIFSSKDVYYNARKQSAQIEAEADKDIQNKLDQQLQSNIDKLGNYLRQLDSLNHSR